LTTAYREIAMTQLTEPNAQQDRLIDLATRFGTAATAATSRFCCEPRRDGTPTAEGPGELPVPVGCEPRRDGAPKADTPGELPGPGGPGDLFGQLIWAEVNQTAVLDRAIFAVA
jgi:hypothetical protein